MDATELLMEDHARVRQLMGRFQRAKRVETQRRLAEELITELSVHSAIEEEKLYPVMRETLDNGDDDYHEAIDEHQRVKEILAQMEDALDEAGSKRFAGMMLALKRDVEHHVREEETEIFPQLREKLGVRRLQAIGKELEEAKKSAPTHPHPQQPPAGEVTGTLTGLVDRVRDRVSPRGR